MSDGTVGGAADENEAETADAMHERVDESNAKLWFLLRANRFLVAGVLCLVVFVSFVAVVSVLRPPFVEQAQSGDTIETMFSTMIPVIVTGTTLVVTIGQVVLTQENGPLGDQRERMSNSMDVREFVGEVVGEPSPSDPGAFLYALIDAAADRARTLRESVPDSADEDLVAAVEDLTDAVTENADSVLPALDGARFGSFDVLAAALNFNYSQKIHRVERIDHEHDDRLSAAQRGALADLEAALSLYGPAREHVKTLYFQWVLIDLSRQILYASIPALIVAGAALAVLDGGTVPGQTMGLDNLVIVVGAAFSATLVPFTLFVAYLLRILTVAKRTLAIEPLILRDTE